MLFVRIGGGGHGYERDANDAGGDVDEAQVDRLLTERVAAKRSREYDKADKLRDELRAMGIEVADKERTWRVRGSGGRGRGRGGDDRGTNGGGPDRGRKRERETDERGGSFANDGSFLDQFETESRHEDSVRQKKGGSSRDDEQDGRDDVGSKSGATQFKKPSAALDPSKMLGMLQSLAGGGSEEGGSGDQPAPAADTPSAGTTDAASEYSSEEDANKLAAEALRAKLMGDMARHEKLMARVAKLKSGGGGGGGGGRSGSAARGGAGGAARPKAAAGKESNEEVVIISELDAQGASHSDKTIISPRRIADSHVLLRCTALRPLVFAWRVLREGAAGRSLPAVCPLVAAGCPIKLST